MSEEKDSVTTKMNLKEKILRIANDLNLSKDGKNTFQNYDYLKPDALMNGLKPLLLKYGVFVYFHVKDRENQPDLGILEVSSVDSDESYLYEMVLDEITVKGCCATQSRQAVRTYAKRYLSMDAFMVADNQNDLDAGKDFGDGKGMTLPSVNNGEKGSVNAFKLAESKARSISTEKNAINPTMTLEIVKKYAPSGKIAEISTIEGLNGLIKELEGVN